MKKRIWIIEDNEPLRDAFKDIVNDDENFKVVGVYESCEDALENLESDCPDIVLMDVELPGMNGVEGTKIIKNKRPYTTVIMVTVYENSKIVFDALCVGATGYLTKNLKPKELVNALYEVENGGAPMSVKIAKMVVQSFQKPTNIKNPLSEREQEVLNLLAEGNSYEDMSEKLYISKNTIKYHIKNIYIKLQVNSKFDAVRIASKRRFI